MYINNNFQSPNSADRACAIEFIIIHYTAMLFNDALPKLLDKKSEVSAHYLIRDNGEIFKLVEDSRIAWHAGESYWLGHESINQNSIGIELDNSGINNFPLKQIESCVNLCNKLMKQYNISPKNFIGHSDIAPNRKLDPGILFDWKLFAQEGFGIWHHHVGLNPQVIYKLDDRGESVLDLQQRFTRLGYKINHTAEFDIQTNYVVRAFQSKFYPEIIQKKGLIFYNDPESLYSWDSESNHRLNILLTL